MTGTLFIGGPAHGLICDVADTAREYVFEAPIKQDIDYAAASWDPVKMPSDYKTDRYYYERNPDFYDVFTLRTATVAEIDVDYESWRKAHELQVA